MIAALAIGRFSAMFADGVEQLIRAAILCPILLAFPLSGSWIAYKRGRLKLGVIITSVLFVMMTLRLRLIISEVKALVSEKHGPDCQNFILFLVL